MWRVREAGECDVVQVLRQDVGVIRGVSVRGSCKWSWDRHLVQFGLNELCL